MNRLEKLTLDLCSNGVEFIVLNTVCEIYDGTHQTPNYTDSGVKFVSVENIGDLYSTSKYISEEDYLKYKVKPQKDDVLMTRIGSVGSCAVVESNEKIAYYVSLALLRPNKEVLNSKYLKYAIESLHGRKELRKRTLVNAVPIKINMGDIGKITIPLPPLDIQYEVVRILDHFTELTAELTTKLMEELIARKKQYKYYEDNMLKFIFSESVQYKSKFLYEIVDFRNGIGHEKSIEENGKYIVVNSKFISTNGEVKKYSNKQISPLYKNDILMVMSDLPNGRALAKCFLVDRDDTYTLNQRVCALKVKDDCNINIKYLFYVLSRNWQLLKYDNGVDQTNLKKDDILNITINVPPIEEQEKIVTILDNFNVLYNNLNNDLSIEIEARKKQYEHYRDKLLTFRGAT